MRLMTSRTLTTHSIRIGLGMLGLTVITSDPALGKSSSHDAKKNSYVSKENLAPKVRGQVFAAKTLPAPVKSEMEREIGQFAKVSLNTPVRDDCFPVRVGGVGRIDIQYLSCSPDAMEKDRQGVKISENITVPDGLALRFNFWRRVYSLWSKNQYVMHVGDFPEVVLEIHDSSRIADLGDKTREKTMRPWLTERRREYQRILIKLHQTRNLSPDQLDPVERRIYDLFQHIDRKDKFFVAAQSIRVQRGQREYIETGLATASRYLPHIEEVFKKEGLPREFARIAFIESSFNLQAMSKVGASGVYQIMPETGRDYLVLADGIDERNDPIKASRAAARLLILNHRILGEWPLAITAYNHGVGGIRRAMHAAGSKDIVTLIERYDGPNFGFASKNFYAGFLGLLATLEQSHKVFPHVVPQPALVFETVQVGGLLASEVKQKYKLTNTQITYLNPDISRAFLRVDGRFPQRYRMKIPPRNQEKAPSMRLVRATVPR